MNDFDEMTAEPVTQSRQAKTISDGGSRSSANNRISALNELERILDAISDAILILNPELKIIACNKSTYKMFAYQSGSLDNKSLQQLIPASNSNNISFYNNYLRAEKNHPPLSDTTMEVSGITKAGEKFPLRLSITELPQSAREESRIILSCHDLSVEKQQEEQLRRTQKMDALGKLTGGIAHDYNNMLGVIVGYTKLLHDALEHNPKLSSYINEVQKATERGTRLSRKLLAFSKNIQSEADILDINATLLAERDMLEKTLTPRIALNYHLGDDVWPVCVNAGDLEDALLNICINAMQSIEFTGSITITTTNCVPNQDNSPEVAFIEGDYVSLSIADTGVGIDPTYLANIFDPFFTTKGQHGVGLGLSMVYGFVKRSQGDIKVKSEPGKGSVFTLYFPRFKNLSPQRETRKPSQENNHQLSGVENVLIVDDEPAMLNLCNEILSSQGYHCQNASSAEQALESINFKDIDVLISDVIMPGMDGYQFVETALKINPSLKTLLISGYTDNRHDNPSSNSRIRLLQKPFTANELLNQVKTVIFQDNDGLSQRSPSILIMDDDENVQTLYKINMERLGYTVELASNGEESIRLYAQAFQKNEAFDVVIMDLTIPGGMGGQDTARALLKIDPDACMVVSSGDSFGDIMSNYQDYGFQAVLEKTFDREKIKDLVETLLSRKKLSAKTPEPA